MTGSRVRLRAEVGLRRRKRASINQRSFERRHNKSRPDCSQRASNVARFDEAPNSASFKRAKQNCASVLQFLKYCFFVCQIQTKFAFFFAATTTKKKHNKRLCIHSQNKFRDSIKNKLPYNRKQQKITASDFQLSRLIFGIVFVTSHEQNALSNCATCASSPATYLRRLF